MVCTERVNMHYCLGIAYIKTFDGVLTNKEDPKARVF
jgi:hypothetical protein